MPTFSYKAREENGKAIVGQMEAKNKNEIALKLQKSGYILTNIEETEESFAVAPIGKKIGRIKTSDMILFNMQLANLVDAGITLLESLKTIALVIINEKFKDIIDRISKSISSGSSFSQSLSEYPKVFPNLFVSMVSAGEQSGTLSLILKRYAVYIEEQEELRQRIKNAVYYPMLLLIFGIGVVVFIVTFVIPKFIETFSKAGVDLPLPTVLVHMLGVGLKNYWYVIIIGILGLIVLVKMYINTKSGRFNFDKFVLALPIIGPLTRKVVMSRFSRTLATLLSSGVPLLTSLDMVSDVVGNEVFARLIRQSRLEVEKGESFSNTIKKSDQFPLDIIQMIAVGEKTGKTPHMLNKIADYYDANINHTVKRLVTLIEPLLIVCMAGVVGLIMASVILPLFDMVKTIR